MSEGVLGGQSFKVSCPFLQSLGGIADRRTATACRVASAVGVHGALRRRGWSCRRRVSSSQAGSRHMKFSHT